MKRKILLISWLGLLLSCLFISTSAEAVSSEPVYRLYDPVNSKHVFTTDTAKQSEFIQSGWKDEKIVWSAPVLAGVPVFQLYNNYTESYFYTVSVNEKDYLVGKGWLYLSVPFYAYTSSSVTEKEKVPVYRLYNTNTSTHFFTANKKEQEHLIASGWQYENIAFYGVR